jgi:hypothetical protein
MAWEDACVTRTASFTDSRSFAELTQAYLGSSLTVSQAFELISQDEFAPNSLSDHAVGSHETTSSIWIGSVGYERYKYNNDFAQQLAGAGVLRLIDVRELPISRRRGYAKTALGEAMAAVDIEYVHVRALGNPKPFRDLYKSGRAVEGRALYQRFLLEERREALHELVELLREKPSALMCVEHDPATCHRTVIIEALRDELGLDLDLVHIG